MGAALLDHRGLRRLRIGSGETAESRASTHTAAGSAKLRNALESAANAVAPTELSRRESCARADERWPPQVETRDAGRTRVLASMDKSRRTIGCFFGIVVDVPVTDDSLHREPLQDRVSVREETASFQRKLTRCL
jgi:hypothetical protein